MFKKLWNWIKSWFIKEEYDDPVEHIVEPQPEVLMSVDEKIEQLHGEVDQLLFDIRIARDMRDNITVNRLVAECDKKVELMHVLEKTNCEVKSKS